LAVATTSLAVVVAAGQVIVSEVSCATCELRLSHVASLGAASDEDSPAERLHQVVHDRFGRYFVIAGFPAARILVYGADGQISAVWGRQGDGPGEFRNIKQLLMLRGDSLAAVDSNNRRLTVLETDGAMARTQDLPLDPFRVGQFSDGSLVVSGFQYTPDGIGFPTHRILSDGSSMPLEPASAILRTRPSAAQRLIGEAGTTAWVARPDRYELTEYSSRGARLRLIKRSAEWFPDRDTEGDVNFAKEPPAPFLRDIHVDEQGLLWIMTALAAEDWQPVSAVGSFASWGRHFDSILEVIDPLRGTIITSRRLKWYGHGFTNDGLIVSHREGPFGVLVLDVWRAELAGR
jgi:hypothetical protein